MNKISGAKRREIFSSLFGKIQRKSTATLTRFPARSAGNLFRPVLFISIVSCDWLIFGRPQNAMGGAPPFLEVALRMRVFATPPLNRGGAPLFLGGAHSFRWSRCAPPYVPQPGGGQLVVEGGPKKHAFCVYVYIMYIAETSSTTSTNCLNCATTVTAHAAHPWRWGGREGMDLMTCLSCIL